MGNRPSTNAIGAGNLDLTGWQIKEKNEQFTVWRNSQTGQEIDEYQRVFSDRRQHQRQRDAFNFRHGSDTLVSALYIKQQAQNDLCSTFYKSSLFLEHIPHRLSNIHEVPYPDVLHLYHQSFRGFAELYDKVGYFDIDEDMICINQQGRVKVWVNPNLSKIAPVRHGSITPSEANMVRTIVNHIHKNTDHTSLPENILDTMRKNNVSTFREADNVLQQIAARNRSIIPDQLDCVLQLGSGQVGQVGQLGRLGQTANFGPAGHLTQTTHLGQTAHLGQAAHLGQSGHLGLVQTVLPQTHHTHIHSNKPATSHSASVYIPSTVNAATHTLNRTLPINSKPVTAHSVHGVASHNSRLTSQSSTLSRNGRPFGNNQRVHPVPTSVVRPVNISSSGRNSLSAATSNVMPFRASNLSGVLNQNTYSGTRLHSDIKKGSSSGLHFTPTPGKSITPLGDISKFKSTSIRQGLPTIPQRNHTFDNKTTSFNAGVGTTGSHYGKSKTAEDLIDSKRYAGVTAGTSAVTGAVSGRVTSGVTAGGITGGTGRTIGRVTTPVGVTGPTRGVAGTTGITGGVTGIAGTASLSGLHGLAKVTNKNVTEITNTYSSAGVRGSTGVYASTGITGINNTAITGASNTGLTGTTNTNYTGVGNTSTNTGITNAGYTGTTNTGYTGTATSDVTNFMNNFTSTTGVTNVADTYESRLQNIWQDTLAQTRNYSLRQSPDRQSKQKDRDSKLHFTPPEFYEGLGMPPPTSCLHNMVCQGDQNPPYVPYKDTEFKLDSSLIGKSRSNYSSSGIHTLPTRPSPLSLIQDTTYKEIKYSTIVSDNVTSSIAQNTNSITQNTNNYSISMTQSHQVGANPAIIHSSQNDQLPKADFTYSYNPPGTAYSRTIYGETPSSTRLPEYTAPTSLIHPSFSRRIQHGIQIITKHPSTTFVDNYQSTTGMDTVSRVQTLEIGNSRNVGYTGISLTQNPSQTWNAANSYTGTGTVGGLIQNIGIGRDYRINTQITPIPNNRFSQALNGLTPNNQHQVQRWQSSDLKYTSSKQSNVINSYSQSYNFQSSAQTISFKTGGSNIATIGGVTGSYQAQNNYGMSLDSDLLSDLRRIKEGVGISPQKDKHTSGEFNLSFGGAGSEYIRDSLKNNSKV